MEQFIPSIPGGEDQATITVYRPRRSERGLSIDAIIGAWAQSKFSLSQSEQTKKGYLDYIDRFRSFLQAQGRDLIYTSEHFVVEIADAAQLFTSLRSPDSRRSGPMAPATIQRYIAIISSFYAYAIKRQHLTSINPIDLLDRPYVEPYGRGARAIPPEEVPALINSLKDDSLKEKRDRAILITLLVTGRRVGELCRLRRKHVKRHGEKIHLNFSRTKGNKQIENILEPADAVILVDWLDSFYGPGVFFSHATSEDAPLWVDIAHKENKPLEYQGVRYIAIKYLNDGQVHKTRATFTVSMLRAGAPLEAVSELLQHSNIGITGRYVKKLDQPHNAFGGKLSDLYRGKAPS